jgi:cell division protein FtsI (penicillin-binding protein 3)
MLEEVVSGSGGTGHRAAIDGYLVAGKTGTALKAQDTGSYVDAAGNKHYFSSFIGFAPADHPQIVVLAAIDEPPLANDQYYASSAAAPLFHTVMQEALRTLRVPPRTDVVVRTIETNGPAAGDLADVAAGGR